MAQKSLMKLSIASILTVATIATTAVGQGNPRGGWTRGGGDASWDSRFDWNP